MICPRWVVTKTQPISIDDVLYYLKNAIHTEKSRDRIIDIGGPDTLTDREMMNTVAEVMKLKRWFIQVPVLTPRLSSLWVGLVTPIPVKPARALVDGVRFETVCENNDAWELFSHEPLKYEQAVINALAEVVPDEDNSPYHLKKSTLKNIESSHLLHDIRTRTINTTAENVFTVLSQIGGEKGWLFANWLWYIRGQLDKLIGGVGLRRNKHRQLPLKSNDILDFWRIEDIVQNKLILLRAECPAKPGSLLRSNKSIQIHADSLNWRVFTREASWGSSIGIVSSRFTCLSFAD